MPLYGRYDPATRTVAKENSKRLIVCWAVCLVLDCVGWLVVTLDWEIHFSSIGALCICAASSVAAVGADIAVSTLRPVWNSSYTMVV